MSGSVVSPALAELDVRAFEAVDPWAVSGWTGRAGGVYDAGAVALIDDNPDDEQPDPNYDDDDLDEDDEVGDDEDGLLDDPEADDDELDDELIELDDEFDGADEDSRPHPEHNKGED